MKNIKQILVALGLCHSCCASAQHHAGGDWLGTLEAGSKNLRIVFHIQESGSGVLQATVDVPDQGVKGVRVPQAVQSGDSLLLSLGVATFNGRWIDDTTIAGTFVQGGETPLTIHRTKLTTHVRPQTPVAPFPYRSEDVTFTNRDNSITYGATLTTPNDNKRHPALILVTGSGQQNRDEEMFGHKPFAVIADYLTRRGFTVLRTDDRGKGLTTGSLTGVTSIDFAQDASTALDYLKFRPEADTQKLGVLGHSEGGMIATILAARRKDIAFIISMAGPGTSGKQTMIEQNNAILRKQGWSDAERSAYLTLYSSIIDVVVHNRPEEPLTAAIEQVIAKWREKVPPDIVQKTTRIEDDSSQHAMAVVFANSIGSAWWEYFLAYDPMPFLRNISCKVLALNGDQDIQVVPTVNLPGWRTGLKSSRSKDYKVIALPGLNHLFQQCSRCDVTEYGELDQTIAPAALAAIGDWIVAATRI